MQPEPEFIPPPKYPWRIFWLLLFAAVFAVAGALPYVLTVLGPKYMHASSLPNSINWLIVTQLLQATLLFGVVIGLGLLLARKVGLSLPLLERAIYGRTSAASFSATAAVLGGVAVGVIIVLGLYDFVARRTPDWPSEAYVPIWMRVLASIYGALDEELLMRLFLFGLFLWILQKLFRQPARNVTLFWIANCIVALIFGLAYLPAAALLVSLNKLIVISIVGVNALGGLVFGYLCWHRGFETAVLAHLVANLIAHFLGPLVSG